MKYGIIENKCLWNVSKAIRLDGVKSKEVARE